MAVGINLGKNGRPRRRNSEQQTSAIGHNLSKKTSGLCNEDALTAKWQVGWPIMRSSSTSAPASMTESTASTARRAFLLHPMHQYSKVTDNRLHRSSMAASFYRFIGSASLLLPRLPEGFNGTLMMSGGLLRFDKWLR